MEEKIKDNKINKDELKLGLNYQEVEERIKAGRVNNDTSTPTKSIKKILAENIFTLFNFTNIILATAVFLVGSYKNLLFLIIIYTNTAISIIQGIKSKKAIDKLSVLAQAKVNALRNGKKQEISINEIVIDDVLLIETGDQIVTDSIIIDGEVEVNEAFITGESDSVYKTKGDMVLSGSFVVSGNCRAKVVHVGEENYTSKISSGVKHLKGSNSEIMKSLNSIVRVVSVAIVPISILLFLHQYNMEGNSIKLAVVNTVAAVIGMIPEGLMLLTSSVLAVSVIKLSKKKVLVQELYCIESLARVDTLCLDKTGTITDGNMKVKDVIEVTISKPEIEHALKEISHALEDNNSTINAIRDRYDGKTTWIAQNIISFSSQKKWSGVNFERYGSYVIGAPEFVLKGKYREYKEVIEKYSEDYRVVVIAHSKNDFVGRELPENVELLGLVLISDALRKNANKTLEYFKRQGVDIKIISGDSPLTVSKVAREVGIEKYNKYIDMQEVKTEEELKHVATNYTIFGRVTPVQKKELIKALKEQGHTVAMTGDGVNDCLALKESDCSIAIASGSDATRNISELVLLDSDFSAMPKIVEEGRKTINNIERSATLFLSKTVYSSILALFFLVSSMPYPYMPIQLTLISVVTIGVPSFVLALEPNKERVKGHFLRNVVSKAMAPALTDVICIIVTVALCSKLHVPVEVYSSMCVVITGFIGIMLLSNLCKPLDVLKAMKKSNNINKCKQSGENIKACWIRTILFFLMLSTFIIGVTVFKDLFSIVIVKEVLPLLACLGILAFILFVIFTLLNKKLLQNALLNKTNR